VPGSTRRVHVADRCADVPERESSTGLGMPQPVVERGSLRSTRRGASSRARTPGRPRGPRHPPPRATECETASTITLPKRRKASETLVILDPTVDTPFREGPGSSPGPSSRSEGRVETDEAPGRMGDSTRPRRSSRQKGHCEPLPNFAQVAHQASSAGGWFDPRVGFAVDRGLHV
jgi:hypothetical protein